MPGHSGLRADRVSLSAMSGIHVLTVHISKEWKAGTSSATTRFALLPDHDG
jgi:hypothetical protein